MAERDALARRAPPPPPGRAGRARASPSASPVDVDRRAGAQVERDEPLDDLRDGSTPPTTLVPPPNGTTAMPSAAQAVEDRRDLPRRCRAAGPRRAPLEPPGAQPDEVRVAAAGGAAHAVLVAVEHVVRPTAAAIGVRDRPRLRQGHLLERDGLGRGSACDAELLAQRIDRAAGGSSSPLAGSPQPHHFIGPRSGSIPRARRGPSRVPSRPRSSVRADRPAHHRRAEPREAPQPPV